MSETNRFQFQLELDLFSLRSLTRSDLNWNPRGYGRLSWNGAGFLQKSRQVTRFCYGDFL